MSASKKRSVYATVTHDEGVNYREIAEVMTQIGFKMNHSSARNYVLRVMRKFADAIIDSWGLEIPEQRKDSIVKSHQFQKAVCDLLQELQKEESSHQKRRL